MSTGLAVRALDEELEFRASRQAVFGYSSFRNALDVYHEKTRPIRPESVEAEMEERNIDRWRGHRNEPDAIRLFLGEKGYQGRHESRQIFAPGSDLVAVHVDGTVYADPEREPPRDQTGIIEAKSPRMPKFARLVSEGVGADYLMQAQFNCAVTGRPWGALVLYNDNHDAGPIVSIEVDADEELGRLMVERAERFMLDHVLAHVPPDPDAWSMAAEPGITERLVGRSGEYQVVEDEAFLSSIGRPLVERYRLQRDLKDSYEEAREEAQAWIEANLDTDAVMLPSGDKIRIVRSEGRTSLDQVRLRDSRPLDRDAFMRAVASGLLTVSPEMKGETGLLAAALQRLELDFSRFESTGRPSSHIRVYPKD